MATFVPFHEAISRLGNAGINFGSDTFKAYLATATPDAAAHTVKADIAEIAAGNGYTAGGATLASVTWAETGAGTGIWQFTAADISWTAAGGDIATHRYLIIYDDTHASDALIGYVDRGSSAVITSGNTRTWDIGSSGLLRIS